MYARDYVDKTIKMMDNRLRRAAGNANEVKEAEAINKKTRKEICCFLAEASNKFDDQNILLQLYRPSIEDWVFSVFRKFDPPTVIFCNTIIG